jgi:hypothetical protein
MRSARLDPVIGFAELANTRISAHPLPQIEDGDVMMLLLFRLSSHMAQIRRVEREFDEARIYDNIICALATPDSFGRSMAAGL